MFFSSPKTAASKVARVPEPSLRLTTTISASSPPTSLQILVAAPSLLLWWPALTGAPSGAFRWWLPLAFGATVLLELMLLWRGRLQSPASAGVRAGASAHLRDRRPDVYEG